jgi:hypothetical protein
MEAGEVEVALSAVERMAADFDVDALATKAATLEEMRDTIDQPETLQAVSQSCLALIEGSDAHGSRSTAEQLAIVALTAARKADDQAQVTLATYRLLKLREQ